MSSTIIFAAMEVADSSTNRLALDQIDSNMRVAWHLLHDLGRDVRIVDRKLVVGTTIINDNPLLVNELHDIVGGVATVFQGDERITTTVKDTAGRFGIGTHLASGVARRRVMNEHERFRGTVDVLGSQYFSGYDPILNQQGEQIGILYVGIKKSDLLGAVTRARLVTVIASSGCIFLIAILFLAVGRHLARQISKRDESLHNTHQQLATALESGSVLGRDIDAARRQISQDAASQRLLAAMFTRIGVPVLLVHADGSIVMSNPACQRMMGYSASELAGRNFNDFTPPEYVQAARAAWSARIPGAACETNMETIARSGIRLRVRMTADILPNTQDQKMRVVTLLPERDLRELPAVSTEAGQEKPGLLMPRARSIGQVQTISLAAIKAATGEDWSRFATRAMLLAEQIIRRRLSRTDVVCHNGDDGFIIWFDGSDEDQNNALLDAAIREVRLKFLLEFGEEIARHVSGVTISEVDDREDAQDQSGEAGPSAKLLERLRNERQHRATAMKALLQEIRDLAAGDVGAVVDRDGRTRPLVMVDFPPEMRSRLSLLSTAVIQETDPGADIDLLRLKLAIRELNRSQNGNDVLVPISWQALASPDRRWSVDECLGKVETQSRKNLILAVSGVPPLPSDGRWRKMIDPFRRQFGSVGLVVTLAQDDPASAQEGMIHDWPLNLLVIDAADRMSASYEKYFNLITHARKRDIGVLVRVPPDAVFSDWRELGATMFTGAQG